LTDREYQRMRDASIAVLRKVGVETGGSNVQFAVNPENGKLIVIEMNPRVSRSSALASKATGFPIARVAAKLAVGYTLDELGNEITDNRIPASFEPSIDYVVTKCPRFTFEKFPGASDRLTTQMHSVGEAMGIGRTFAESLQKTLRSLEIGVDGLDPIVEKVETRGACEQLLNELRQPGPRRLWYLADAFRHGIPYEDIFAAARIDPWFLATIRGLIEEEQKVAAGGFAALDDPERLHALKRLGFADSRLARLTGCEEADVRDLRKRHALHPVYKRVDSCAAEFPVTTAYQYSTYEEENEAEPSARKKIMVLGGGPNRVGQGIEFDYCCVQAALALREADYETIMVNCNPETVSTDFDISDRLYFEPLTFEDVIEIVELEKPEGIIVQFCGQTPLKLARALEAAGAPIIGTSPDAIDRAEDRERFQQLITKLGLRQPANHTARSLEEALEVAAEVGYPLIVRPSYVLGGRAMETVYSDDDLRLYMQRAVSVSNAAPVLLDHFLDEAVEVDVDVVADGERVVIGGIMEHVEQAGVHSGDSGASLPPHTLSAETQGEIARQCVALATELGVVGLMNVQFAIQNDDIYVLEVNPRASRSAPFVAKATGLALPRAAALAMVGVKLAEQGIEKMPRPPYYSVKESVFPFIKFRGADPILGPEMKSTGEVMGTGANFGEAYSKAQFASGVILPSGGRALLSVRDADKPACRELARALAERGFELVATHGTERDLLEAGIPCAGINKVREGRPHVVDLIKNDELSLIVNTTADKRAIEESRSIRREAVAHKVTYYTTIAAAKATIQALDYTDMSEVDELKTLHRRVV